MLADDQQRESDRRRHQHHGQPAQIALVAHHLAGDEQRDEGHDVGVEDRLHPLQLAVDGLRHGEEKAKQEERVSEIGPSQRPQFPFAQRGLGDHQQQQEAGQHPAQAEVGDACAQPQVQRQMLAVGRQRDPGQKAGQRAVQAERDQAAGRRQRQDDVGQAAVGETNLARRGGHQRQREQAAQRQRQQREQPGRQPVQRRVLRGVVHDQGALFPSAAVLARTECLDQW